MLLDLRKVENAALAGSEQVDELCDDGRLKSAAVCGKLAPANAVFRIKQRWHHSKNFEAVTLAQKLTKHTPVQLMATACL